MLRASSFITHMELNNQENEVLLYHGYSGAFDVVPQSVSKMLQENESSTESFETLSQDDQAVLLRRGYLTHKSREEEIDALRKIASVLHKKEQESVSLTIIPSYNCNFRCSYCFEKKQFEKGTDWLQKVMSREMVDAIFDQAQVFRNEGKKVNNVTLFGGEPLLPNHREVVAQIVDRARALQMHVDAVTNGYSLEHYQDLLGPEKIAAIQITLDGFGETHDGRRHLVGRQPTFQKIIDNIELSLETGVQITVRSNINKDNLAEVPRLIELFKSRGWFEKKNFRNYFKSNHKCYEPVPDEAISDIEVMKEIGQIVGDTKRFQLNTYYSSIAQRIKILMEQKTTAQLRGSYCGGTSGLYTIDPFGEIFACWDVLGEPQEVIGTVDVSNKQFVMTERNKFWRERGVENMPECYECKFSLFCGGGCAAFARIEKDDSYSAYCLDFEKLFRDIAPSIYLELAAKA